MFGGLTDGEHIIGLLDRFRGARERDRLVRAAELLIAKAERAQVERNSAEACDDAKRALDLLEQAREAGYPDLEHLDLRLAQAWLLQGQPRQALAPAYAAARARPYDVESRVTHGRLRLSLGEVEAARHEFESVLEEFGGDPVANAGLRATALASGELPLDEDDEIEEGAEREAGAAYLVAAWELSDSVRERIEGLRGASDPGLVELLEEAAARRSGPRSTSAAGE